MNLDALYSELTLKTGAKLVLAVLDGLGDLAVQRTEQHDAAGSRGHTPNLDALARESARRGG